ncbi:MAG: hypothetical protein RI940_1460 [Bacteroidota bacterium]|jgi:hypothetical protein
MKKNLIAIFLTAIIFLQIIPLASFIQIAKEFDNEFANENEIALSISLEQLEEDNIETAKIFTDKLDFKSMSSIQFEKQCRVHFSQNHKKPNKGFVSIFIAPPNFNVKA